MKTRRLLAIAILLVAAATFTAGAAQEHPARTEHPAPAATPAGSGGIVGVAAADGEFKTFTAAVEAAGLAEKLRGKGPFTVFAPTDEAFAKLPEGVLDNLLKPANKALLAGLLADHIVPGILMSADIITMKSTAVSGQVLGIANVGDGLVLVEGAKVVRTDIVADSGVIHAVDAVIVTAGSARNLEALAAEDRPGH